MFNLNYEYKSYQFQSRLFDQNIQKLFNNYLILGVKFEY